MARRAGKTPDKTPEQGERDEGDRPEPTRDPETEAAKGAAPAGEKPADPRTRAVDALMTIAAVETWDFITLPMIAKEAGMSLADLRDVTPSKGALLASFTRMIDRKTLDAVGEDMAGEPGRDRLLDVMMKRFDALSPYRDALKAIAKAARRDPVFALALNQLALNSFRYMLAAAEIDTEDELGAVRIQGAVVVFARAFDVFVDEDDPALPRTMATLDRELKRGVETMGRIEDLSRLAAPFRGFFRAMADRPRDARGFGERMRDRFEEMREGLGGRRERYDDEGDYPAREGGA